MNTFSRLLVAILSTGVLAGLTVVTAAPAQAATVVSDGSFETPSAPVNFFVDLGPGASIGAWTVSRGHVDLKHAGYWQAADGSQSVDLSGSNPSLMGGVAQSFATVPFRKYRVTYKLAGNPEGPPAIKSGQLLANGKVIQRFFFDTTGKTNTNMGYVRKTAVFVATGRTSTIEFQSNVDTLYGPVLDNVVVQRCGCFG